jgi:hypothetical protein
MQQSKKNPVLGQGVKSVLEGIRSETRQDLFNLTVAVLEEDPKGQERLIEFLQKTSDADTLFASYTDDIRGLLASCNAYEDIEVSLVPGLFSNDEDLVQCSEDKQLKIHACLTVLDGIKDLKDKSNLLSNLIIITSFAVAAVGIALVVGVSIPALPILTPAIGIGLILAAVIGTLVVLGQRASQNNVFSSWMQGFGKGTSDTVTKRKEALLDFAEDKERMPSTVKEYKEFASGGALSLDVSPKAASAHRASKEGSLASGLPPIREDAAQQPGASSEPKSK